MRKKGYLIVFVLFVCCSGYTQHQEGKFNNVIGINFGYTNIPSASKLDNDIEGLFIPSFGLDYFVLLTDKVGLGVMLDYELDHYLITKKELEIDHVDIGDIGGGII